MRTPREHCGGGEGEPNSSTARKKERLKNPEEKKNEERKWGKELNALEISVG